MDKPEKHSFLPFPELKTNRLILRSINYTDEKEILFFRSDSRVLEHLDMPAAKNLEDARAFIKKIQDETRNGELINWCITLAGKANCIGTICLWNISLEENSAEIGYVLHPDYQGKGIMQEAAKVVIDYGFKQMKLATIIAKLSPQNFRSVSLLEKNNFQSSPLKKDLKTVQYFLKNSFDSK